MYSNNTLVMTYNSRQHQNKLSSLAFFDLHRQTPKEAQRLSSQHTPAEIINGRSQVTWQHIFLLNSSASSSVFFFLYVSSFLFFSIPSLYYNQQKRQWPTKPWRKGWLRSERCIVKRYELKKANRFSAEEKEERERRKQNHLYVLMMREEKPFSAG